MVDWQEKITRRTAVKVGAVAALTGVSASGADAASRRHGARLLRQFVSGSGEQLWLRSSYTPLLGQRFSIAGRYTRLQLVKIQDVPYGPKNSEDAFMLVFRAPRPMEFTADRVPVLCNPSLGRVPMLLTPGQTAQSGQSFLAVVNRVVG